MEKQALIDRFIKNHEEFTAFVGGLEFNKLTLEFPIKWSAVQHLKHVSYTLSPFSKALLSKQFLLDTFGSIQREPWNYSTVLDNYLKTSLKAPEQFIPNEYINPQETDQLIYEISDDLTGIKELLMTYTEIELDKLSLPHPLLGLLSIREMFYLMSYHPKHHQKQLEEMLISM